jgi:hypothetical protein
VETKKALERIIFHPFSSRCAETADVARKLTIPRQYLLPKSVSVFATVWLKLVAAAFLTREPCLDLLCQYHAMFDLLTNAAVGPITQNVGIT